MWLRPSSRPIATGDRLMLWRHMLMTKRARVAFIGLWLVSLLAVGTLASGQFRPFEPIEEPFVLIGNDLGFRVEGFVGEEPAGMFVIRFLGEWVEPVNRNALKPPRLLR
jgi:hypothetical protein